MCNLSVVAVAFATKVAVDVAAAADTRFTSQPELTPESVADTRFTSQSELTPESS